MQDAGNTDKFLIFNTEGKCEEFIAYDTSADLVGNTGKAPCPRRILPSSKAVFPRLFRACRAKAPK